MTERKTIYSIGHSNHSIQDFVTLLETHSIETLADVRSQPFSRWHPQFNRETLAAALEQAGIHYRGLGGSLGGRPEQADLYDPGNERPNYERQAQTPLFRQGLRELQQLATEGRTVMMCSEGEPDQCHRTLLITPALLEDGYTVQHILPDGRLRQAERKARQLGFDF